MSKWMNCVGVCVWLCVCSLGTSLRWIWNSMSLVGWFSVWSYTSLWEFQDHWYRWCLSQSWSRTWMFGGGTHVDYCMCVCLCGQCTRFRTGIEYASARGITDARRCELNSRPNACKSTDELNERCAVDARTRDVVRDTAPCAEREGRAFRRAIRKGRDAIALFSFWKSVLFADLCLSFINIKFFLAANHTTFFLTYQNYSHFTYATIYTPCLFGWHLILNQDHSHQ